MSQKFEILDERTREYKRFNDVGTQLTVRLNPPSEDDTPPDTITHFLASINELFEYALQNVDDADMVGLVIRKLEDEKHISIGFSYRRKDQVSGDVIWSVFEKVFQPNSRFNALDKLVIEVNYEILPVGFGRAALKTKGRPVSEMVHLKRSIIRVQVKTENNSLAHALIIAKAKLTNDPNYKSYRQGYKILPIVQQLLQTTGIDLSNGVGIPELIRFQDHFRDYKIVIDEGLHCEILMFEGYVESTNRIYLL
jgi:hypothetical protein